MKTLSKFIAIGAISLVTVTSCKQKTEETTTTIPVKDVAMEAQSKGNATVVDMGDVPDSIHTSFMVKYPGATKVVWKKYEPQEDDGLSRDDQYYYATYYNDGADYTSWYNNRGLWARTSTVISGPKELPDAVNKTVNAKFPGYTIEKIEKEEDEGVTEYELKLTKGELTAKLKVLPNGEISKQKLKD